MIVYYDATERVDEYGKSKFYEMVRENISEIFEKSGLEILANENHGSDKAIIEIYQKYAYAFVIGIMMNNSAQFEDNFFEELNDPVGGWRQMEEGGDEWGSTVWSESVVPNTYGSIEQQNTARITAVNLFNEQGRNQTDLAGLVRQLYPGRYLNHYGDDFKGLVVVCEHESLF
ncbi:hypothetical protein pEaSNUABM8_00030 [Erwinia phage pEa_SNUABM_8]|nr:hypothetical protein pEaSNUABM8_00030 [Erwinia phage pEa_SNUABM_8]QVW54782.1 hypothetical protein pEaSNUABM4_00029 [Erwinia phage pEa_SNUABM_4]